MGTSGDRMSQAEGAGSAELWDRSALGVFGLFRKQQGAMLAEGDGGRKWVRLERGVDCEGLAGHCKYLAFSQEGMGTKRRALHRWHNLGCTPPNVLLIDMNNS